MKLLTFTMLLFAIVLQDEQQISNFYLENQSVQYRKVFELNNTSDSVMIKKLNSYLPTVSCLTNIQFNGNVFTGRIENLTVDYKKYGGRWGTTWIALNHPMNGNLTIQVKNNKYRVIISDMEFISTSPYIVYDVNGTVTRKRGTEFSANNTIIQGLDFLDKCFTEKFTISEQQLDDNW